MFVVLVLTVAISVAILLQRIPMGLDDIVGALTNEVSTTSNKASKLTVIDFSFSWSSAYSFLAVIVGWTLFYLAAFGTDQDLVQRMLTCKTQRAAGWSQSSTGNHRYTQPARC